MYVVDQDTCIGCGACEGTCPVGAIAGNDEGKFSINDTCVDCGACAGGCPVGAIVAGE
ncbi:MAG: 4Fe-4S binding protein [Fusobacterium sp. JB021]|nr:4Fe-4S binding protein [Fusobacterium sp. JB021]MDP0506758.1 4Fe-4S binding protein [Fusobacterium sp. JB019]